MQGDPRIVGGVSIHIGLEGDLHIDCAPGFERERLAQALDLAEHIGLEALDPEECEAERLADGTKRIWLTPRLNSDPIWQAIPGLGFN